MPRKFVESMGNALRGMRFLFRTQRNVVIHFFFGILAILVGIALSITTVEMIILILVISSVIVLEFVNTAIEEVVNMLLIHRKMRAMVAKDIAAAAVLISSITAVIVGILIFAPRIADMIVRF